jgi:hypothetical protein
MNWYVTKIVYQIICGDGQHAAQFDEQLRLVQAHHEEEAFEKAVQIGETEADVFFNQKQELVQWKFINVAELYRLSEFIDGAEIHSRIREVDDAENFISFVNQKAGSIQEKTTHQLLNLI